MNVTNNAPSGAVPTRESGDTETTYLGDKFSRISLKQWHVFHAVIDYDGFLGAAENLHVSQSSVSHALAKLQEQLGVSLFTIKGRKACITDDGKILLRCSRALVREALKLEALGENLRNGWQPDIRVAVEPNFPAGLLMRTFRGLASVPRNTRLNVEEVSHQELRKALHDDSVDVAFSTEMVTGFPGKKVMEIEHLAIAHPDNPLFKLRREITFEDLRSQFRIILHGTNDVANAESACGTSHSPPRWKMNSLDSTAEALSHGMGYTWLPRYRVQPWLDQNLLKILPLNSGSSYMTSMYLIRGRSVTPGTGASAFADALQAAMQDSIHQPGNPAAHAQASTSAND